MYVLDSAHVFHVAKAGSDANSGHAAQYPINLATNAKLTIASAITAAASGDTIVIWPGDYAENVNFNGKAIRLEGQGYASRIAPTTGEGIVLADNCALKNLTVYVSNSGQQAVYSSSAVSNILIDGCFISGGFKGLYLVANSSDITLLNSYFFSNDVAAYLGSCSRIKANLCTFRMADPVTPGDSYWSVSAGGGVYSNCIFQSYRNDALTSTSYHAAIRSESGAASFNNCFFYAQSGSTFIGSARTIYLNSASAKITFNNCVFKSTAANGTALDIYSDAAGVICVSNSLLDTTKVSMVAGTLVYGGSGLEAAVNAQADAALADYNPLNKAIKFLTNKVTQTKSSGVVKVYDDDGSTIIATLTPTEDDSTITLTPS
jgi:hypothetical protein